jgi:hypothetical protein
MRLRGTVKMKMRGRALSGERDLLKRWMIRNSPCYKRLLKRVQRSKKKSSRTKKKIKKERRKKSLRRKRRDGGSR